MKPIFAHALLATAISTLLAGCVSMAPQYQRPSASVAEQFGTTAVAGATANAVTAMPAWRDVFLEPRLQQAIALALDNNRDLRVAMLQVEKDQAQYRIQRAAQLPSLDASGSISRSRISRAASDSGAAQISESDSLQLGISGWELDLFGRVRSLRDEALQTWLATSENQRAVRLSLVAQVATAWLAVDADQQALALATQTLDSQQRTLRLSEARHAQGMASGLDLSQVQSSVESAAVDLAKRSTQLAQDRDALQLLLGAPLDPALLPLPPASTASVADDAVALAQLPSGLGSQVLLQRPDVLAAEHTLQAANADIGAARAAFFPSISLTANLGHGSDALSTLFAAGSRSWSFVPSITAPIFHAGALKASLDAARIGKDIGVAQYQKAIQQAFSEVADALAERQHIDQQLRAQQALVQANQRSYTLADARYRIGLEGYLQALDAQRSLYAAQQDLIALRQQEAGNRVTLFKVLGGGADARSEEVAGPG